MSRESTELGKFQQKALRRGKRGITEHIICQHLFKAVHAKPLAKIISVCDAARMLNENQKKGIDFEQIDVMYKVALAFRSATCYRHYNAEYCIIPWSFEGTKDEYERYIKVWWNQAPLRYYPYIGGGWPSEIERERQETEDTINKMWKVGQGLEKLGESGLHHYFFTITRAELSVFHGLLTDDSAVSLRNMFVDWAMPKVAEIYSKVAQQMDANVYREIFRVETEREREGETVGGQMGPRQ